MQNQTYEAVAIECVVRYDTKGPFGPIKSIRMPTNNNASACVATNAKPHGATRVALQKAFSWSTRKLLGKNGIMTLGKMLAPVLIAKYNRYNLCIPK